MKQNSKVALKISVVSAAISSLIAVPLEANYGVFSGLGRYAGSSIPYVKNYVDSREQVERRREAELRAKYGLAAEQPEEMPLRGTRELYVVSVDYRPDFSSGSADFEITAAEPEELIRTTNLNLPTGQKKKKSTARRIRFIGEASDATYKTFVADLNQGDMLRIDFEKGRTESRVTRYTNPMPEGESPIFLRTGPDGRQIINIDRDGMTFVTQLRGAHKKD